MLIREFEFLQLLELAQFTSQYLENTNTLPLLSQFITELKRDMLPQTSLVLLIDEVDKSSNNDKNRLKNTQALIASKSSIQFVYFLISCTNISLDKSTNQC
jgi:hypothetical protein